MATLSNASSCSFGQARAPRPGLKAAALLLLAGSSPALGQWQAGFMIERVGLFGPEQTGAFGFQYSEVFKVTEPGFAAGLSNRYLPGGAANGVNTWAYNPITHNTIQTGLVDAAHTGTARYQFSTNEFQNASGQVAGNSQRITGTRTENGASTWVYKPATNSTVQTGLIDAAYTGSGGYRFGGNDFQNAAGRIAGFSNPILGARTINGTHTWSYDPATDVSHVTGLSTPAHVGTLGYRFSENEFLSASGHSAGHSHRIQGASTVIGQNAWSYSPDTNATVTIGLTGSTYTGTSGYQYSVCNLQNSSGFVAGTSRRIAGLDTSNGENTWLYSPATNFSAQVGLTSTLHTGAAGYQFSAINLLSDSGQAVGTSRRILDVVTANGQNSWVFNRATNTTETIGLTGPAYTGSAGYQFSINNFQNEAGQIVGRSSRITGVRASLGENTWVFDPVTRTTSITGLTGPEHTGSTGYQLSLNNFQSASGQLTGRSRRIIGVNTNNGENTWIYLPGSGTTIQTGLTGPDFTGSAGFQDSTNQFQNAAGQVVGHSTRISGLSSYNGRSIWVYNPGATAMEHIGLLSAAHSGSAGFQSSFCDFQNAAGELAGTSRRITGVNTDLGANSWVYSPITHATVQTGLTGPRYTGTTGYQSSTNSLLNGFGQAAGYSLRITGVSSTAGQDVWYYDPTTQISSAIIGSVRTADQYAFSVPTILTEGGFLMGYYLHFPGGVGSGEKHAFVFRPDVGMTDLGNLVNGGLALAGWATLQNPIFSDALNTIIGYGSMNGQTIGQSVFAMTVPAPGGFAFLGVLGALARQRRRV